ncbi:MAG: (2S)-methylsuccinyl-CoA dehydrogenase [Candidatus Azotimanducaceae bacterium]|jgi:(2S)-methylsuccinyl-CoA dehydrogenase
MNYTFAFEFCNELINKSLSYLRESAIEKEGASLDDHQQSIYDLSFSYAELKTAENFQLFSHSKTDREQGLANVFAADVINQILNRLKKSPQDIGLSEIDFSGSDGTTEDNVREMTSQHLSVEYLSKLGSFLSNEFGNLGDRGLDEEKQLMADTFHQFGVDVVEPHAEKIHREDIMIPDTILDGLRALGCFGLSVPEKFGGLLPNDKEDNLGMIVVTEELSRSSLAGAGSLITRPEIMARALLEGGTTEQQEHWLPKLAAGDPLCGIAITEPDYGSDVASVRLQATEVEGGWLLNGAKTWSTFAGKAGVLLTLARTDSDLTLGHRGLSLFMVEKPSTDDHKFTVNQESGGSLSGVSIPTVAYRGMHSYQLFFDNFFVPSSHLLGGERGLGKGFYYTMRGFMGGRIQTAARACGVMQAAFDTAVLYANDRKVFGKPISNYQLTQCKLARMAAYLAACRQYTYTVGKLMDEGKGQIEVSLAKLLSCKTAEWLCREAMQLHGGMGFAEESAVSRYWLDARVLSIFEGTEEILALKVIGRHLVENSA